MPSDAFVHVGLAAAGRAPTGFYRRHLLCPLLAFIAAAVALEVFDIDRAWAGRLYMAQGNDWTLRSSFVADTVIHTGGRSSGAKSLRPGMRSSGGLHFVR